MRSPCLFVVAHADCTVRVSCSQPAELRRVEPGERFAAVTAFRPYEPQDLRLDAGLYHVMSSDGVSCQVLDGSCSVLLAFGGEDPWPVPPPPGFASVAECIAAASAYLRAIGVTAQ
jgi:hypothetical protein